MRILHGPVNVGNQPWSVSRAERSLGHKSDVIVNYGTWLGYPADRTLSEYAKNVKENRWRRSAFALSAPFLYDVIHYYFGRSFLLWDDFGRVLGRSPERDRDILRDVRIAKSLGRKLFMTLQGCDARQAKPSNMRNAVTMCRPNACSAYETCVSELDADRQHMIDLLLPLMDRVFFLNPELGHGLKRGDFLPYGNVDIQAIRPEFKPPEKAIRILHAPSNGGVKGTPQILQALENLKGRFEFELLLIENTPHAQAMEMYRSADIAIDQLLAGWYGGFAVELMAMGKPVAAYIRDEDRKFVPPAMWDNMPILRIDERSLEDDLARILSAPETLLAAGAESRAYVEKWHDPKRIAEALIRIYRDPTAPLAFDQSPEKARA